MSGAGENFGWGLRLLIMAYGFCLVLIGLDPIKKQHGSLANFLSKDSIVRAAEAFDPKKLIPAASSSTGGVSVQQKTPASQEKLDQLTVDDRKQLNKLMEGL